MSLFKQEAINTKEILDQSLWLNQNISINNKYVDFFFFKWENNGISYLRHILNGQCEPLTHNELKQKYHINTTFLQTTLKHKCIAKQWLCKLKNCNNIAQIHKLDIKLKVNKKYTSITKITCKDFYWHIINKQKHTSTNIKKWCTICTGFNNAEVSIWNRIFKIAF